MPSLVIAVATYRRPGQLLLLLESVARACAEVSEVEVRIIVVDNDPARSAEEVCAGFRDIPLEYLVQPRPGIPAPRNSAVEAARGSDFIVFVDDDEWVSPQWLSELLRVQAATGAGLVAGPVYSVLPEYAPSIIVDSGIFDLPTRADGVELSEAGSGNLMCEYRVFSTRPPLEWFQEAFALTGGSDAELTRRFCREGERIVWAAAAEAWEPVPEARLSLAWLARRYRRVGSIDHRLGGQGWLWRARGIIEGVARMSTGAPRLLWRWVFERRLDAAAFRRVFRGVGYVEAALGWGHKEYGRT